MKIHWADKWLSIPYDSSTAIIQGMLYSGKEQWFKCISYMIVQCRVWMQTMLILTQLHDEIQALLQSYQDVFAAKVQYPQPRSCEHYIPLVQGATPFYIRPYRYAPVLKTEIEAQVQEMLKVGLIQHSSIPFSSHVMLVKKKDNTYRLCVDYRHLNAITVKDQYLVPVIDKLLDELNGASWFSSLDLCAGFHQIPMNLANCFKTSFQTHVGHYEF
jgi:hypothetical protein